MTASALQAAPPKSGIQGRAALYISYGPPVQAGPGLWLSTGDLMGPTATTFSILSARSGHKIGDFSVDASGAFTMPLPPGKYILVPDTLKLGVFPFAYSLSTDSFAVTVRPGKFAYALILYYQKGPGVVVTGTLH